MGTSCNSVCNFAEKLIRVTLSVRFMRTRVFATICNYSLNCKAAVSNVKYKIAMIRIPGRHITLSREQNITKKKLREIMKGLNFLCTWERNAVYRDCSGFGNSGTKEKNFTRNYGTVVFYNYIGRYSCKYKRRSNIFHHNSRN